MYLGGKYFQLIYLRSCKKNDNCVYVKKLEWLLLQPFSSVCYLHVYLLSSH